MFYNVSFLNKCFVLLHCTKSKALMTQTSITFKKRLLKAKISLNKASLTNDITALAYCIELAKTIEHGSLKDVSILFNFYKKTI